jgi:KaiC/GvpD/RAD55 family RecA-like ATPase
MKKLKLSQEWLKKLLPEGLPYPTSTLISGPGGSGKPLVGFAFASDWLKAGGNIIFIALQYAETKFIKTSLKQVYNINVDEYQNNVAYIQFEHDMDSWVRIDSNTLKANLLKSDVWEEAVKEAESFFDVQNDLGTLVFASALNLLLFSPTYKEINLDRFEELLRKDKSRTYIFSVSTSAFREDIKRLEEAADNLMFARIEGEMELYLRVDKIENKDFYSEEIKVPIKKETLESIKEVAESVRKREIPKLKKI